MVSIKLREQIDGLQIIHMKSSFNLIFYDKNFRMPKWRTFLDYAIR